MKILLQKFGLAALLMVVVASANAVPNLGFSDKKLKVAVGELLTFDLSVHKAEKLDGGGFNLSYDPALIEVISVDFDGRWEFKTSQGSADAGLISDLGFATFKPVSDTAKIATITVKALAPGRTFVRTQKATAVPFAVDGSEVRLNMAKIIIKIK